MKNEPVLITREQIATQRAQFGSQLCIAEHELAEARARTAKLEKDVEQYRGALQACDVVLKLPPPAAPEDTETRRGGDAETAKPKNQTKP